MKRLSVLFLFVVLFALPVLAQEVATTSTEAAMPEVNQAAMDDAQVMQVASAEKMDVGNKICPVSKEKIESMDEAVKVEYEGKIYTLCCKMCLKDFNKDPKKYIEELSKLSADEGAMMEPMKMDAMPMEEKAADGK